MYSDSSIIYGFPITEKMEIELCRLEGKVQRDFRDTPGIFDDMNFRSFGGIEYSGNKDKTTIFVGEVIAYEEEYDDDVDEITDEDDEGFILNGEDVSSRYQVKQEDIDKANQKIAEFAKQFPDLYAMAPKPSVFKIWETL